MLECMQINASGLVLVALFVVTAVVIAVASLALEYAWLSLREAMKRRKGAN